MTTSRTILAAVIALALSTSAAAQATTSPPEPQKPAEKASAPAKPKKPVAKKTPAKKADSKKPDTRKPAAPTTPPKVFTTGPREVRDKDGNVIPTSPDAFNVDSAMPPKPRK